LTFLKNSVVFDLINNQDMNDINLINLQNIEAEVAAFGTILFEKIMNIPQKVRNDDKERTGIRIMIRETQSRNLIIVPVLKPSPLTEFFVVEKAVRSEIKGDYTSGNSHDQSLFRFHGSITIEIGGKKIQISVSGLQEEEDTAFAIKIAAHIFKLTESGIIDYLSNKHEHGRLPASVIGRNKDNYLYKFMMDQV